MDVVIMVLWEAGARGHVIKYTRQLFIQKRTNARPRDVFTELCLLPAHSLIVPAATKRITKHGDDYSTALSALVLPPLPTHLICQPFLTHSITGPRCINLFHMHQGQFTSSLIFRWCKLYRRVSSWPTFNTVQVSKMANKKLHGHVNVRIRDPWKNPEIFEPR